MVGGVEESVPQWRTSAIVDARCRLIVDGNSTLELLRASLTPAFARCAFPDSAVPGHA